VVLKFPFHCPTKLIDGLPFDEALAGILEGRSWSLLTSDGWPRRGIVDRLMQNVGTPNSIVSGIAPNPLLASIPRLESELKDADVVVALGGGSVIDACKAVLALRGSQPGGEAALISHLREGQPLPDKMQPLPLIAIPTTSGTGSEVTRWGTIWGDDGIKHSVTDPRLFPSHSILDPELLLSMPRALTLSTALDALSHAMESVWNHRHTSITDSMATTAIRMIREALEPALKEPQRVDLRTRLQTASVIAGLAMGTTQTALAHSISYPFTAHFNVPHGLACSFTLAEVARYNLVEAFVRLRPIADGLGCQTEDIPDELERWFGDVGMGSALGDYVWPSVTDDLGDNVITRARAANNIRTIDGPAARQLARAALERFLP